MSTAPLTALTLQDLDAAVDVPTYERTHVTVGIVHFGVGAFHRAHQAVFIDRCLAEGEHDWGICGVGVLAGDARIRDVLDQQDGLYTLITVDPEGHERAQVVGSHVAHLHAPDDPVAVLEVLCRPTTRIVTLTITEGGYGITDDGRFDPTDALTLADIGHPSGAPQSAFGFIVRALAMRREAGIGPFTVLSCDNIPGNGQVARAAITGVAAPWDQALAEWIHEEVSFPSSMVDRITPQTTDEVRRAVAGLGIEDGWPVRAESFIQWVVEDDFCAGRPRLDRAGVQLVADVAPYEKMKLRLLNASHQAIAYLGLMSGYTYVHEAMADPSLVQLVEGYLRVEAVPTLDPVPGVDVEDYCQEILARLSSASIQDTLARLAVDGSDRIPKFLLPVVSDQLATDGEIAHASLALAAWSLFIEGATSAVPDDRQIAILREAVDEERRMPGAFLRCETVFGRLGSDERLAGSFRAARAALLADGPRQAIMRLDGIEGGSYPGPGSAA